MTDDASWEGAVTRTVSELGGFDILINNAGIEISALVIDLDAAELRRMLDVNIVGTALGIKHAFRAMRPDGPAGAGRRRRQHLLGRRDHPFPRHRGLLGEQVGSRPAHQGRRAGVRDSWATACG